MLTDPLRYLGLTTGGVPDGYDARDFADPLAGRRDIPLPATVDLRQWCPPIKQQGKLNACTAHAGTTLVEYYQRRTFDQEKPVALSRLFLYTVTRKLLEVTDRSYRQDKGANPRTTMKSLALFGVPPEEFWPYDETRIYDDPPAFCYALAASNRAVKYFRLDTKGLANDQLLLNIRAHLACGRPLMFSMVLYPEAMHQAGAEGGKVPLPGDFSQPPMYHTVAAVGYDDGMQITGLPPGPAAVTRLFRNRRGGGPTTTGAILFHNSWGESWGDKGSGWLPYDYVTRDGAAAGSGPARLSFDWWTLMKQDWLQTGLFEAKK
jgi:C1A family cysteine protease